MLIIKVTTGSQKREFMVEFKTGKIRSTKPGDYLVEYVLKEKGKEITEFAISDKKIPNLKKISNNVENILTKEFGVYGIYKYYEFKEKHEVLNEDNDEDNFE